MRRREAARLRLLDAARRAHRTVLFPAFDFLLPATCFACGSPLGRWQHLGACASCWSGLHPVPSPVCLRCGIPAPAGTDLLGPARGRCARCLVSPPVLDAVRAAVLYDSLARRFLLRAKLGGRRELLLPLARQLAAAARANGIHHGCSVVAPVPSHPLTDLRRGFSPSLEMARCLARLLRLPLRRRLLRRRVRPGGPTKRLGAAQRLVAAEREFRVRRSVHGATVLLVDDVATTGASGDACARLLKEEGAAEVRLAVWARTPGH